MFGTVTLAGRLVGSPIESRTTPAFHVNESIIATRVHGRLPISTRQFEHSHFCSGAVGRRMSELSPLTQRTVSASHSRSKYAASLLDPSIFGNVTDVID